MARQLHKRKSQRTREAISNNELNEKSHTKNIPHKIFSMLYMHVAKQLLYGII